MSQKSTHTTGQHSLPLTTQKKKRLHQWQPNQLPDVAVTTDRQFKQPSRPFKRGKCTMPNSNVNPQQYSLSIAAQEHRVLAYLMENQQAGINRYEADDLLNVCHLGARIHALRAKGHVIIKIPEIAPDLNGRLHRGIGRYFWQGREAPISAANTEPMAA